MILTGNGQTWTPGAEILSAPVVRPGYGPEWSAVPDPAWQETLTLLAGVNIFGEPNVRVVWAPSRLELSGGEWHDFDEHGGVLRTVRGVRLIPKYAHIGERWILEKWCPAEHYGSPELWYQQTEQIIGLEHFDTIGPYPHRGEYEHVFTFENPDDERLPQGMRGGFTAPTRQRLERWWSLASATREMTYRERLAAIKARKDRAEKAKDSVISDRYDDRVGEAWYGVPHVSFAGSKSTGRRVRH